jgi:hypothetical protein
VRSAGSPPIEFCVFIDDKVRKPTIDLFWTEAEDVGDRRDDSGSLCTSQRGKRVQTDFQVA